MVGAGLAPHVVVADFERPRHVDAEIDQHPHEVDGAEIAVARRHSMAQAVVLVVGERRRAWPVAHLDAGDQLGRDCPDQVEVVRATGVMPDVDADAAVRSVGRLDDRQRVRGVDDVGERQELEADDGAVVGGAIAHLAEPGGSVGDRPFVRSDRLDVPTLERVDEFPHDVLESPVVGARCRRPPAGQHLDLGEAHVGGVEHLAELLDREPGRSQLLELPGVQPDPGEAASAAARIRSSSG